MQKQLMDMFEQSSDHALESARKLAELNLSVLDRMGRQQAELAGYYLDAGARGLALLAGAKGHEDLMAAQAGLLREWNERHLEALRQGIGLGNQANGEYHALAREGWQRLQTRMAEMVATANPATPA